MKYLYASVCLLFSVLLSAQNTAHIGLEAVEVNDTQKVYNYYVQDYEEIVACQFSLTFDSDKMRYNTLRNSIVTGLNESSIGTSADSILTLLWVDFALNPVNYTDSTVLFQFVFDVLVSGGSELCFYDEPLALEFVSYINEIETELPEILITDDCNTDSLVILDSTISVAALVKDQQKISHLFLSPSGTIGFTTLADQGLGLTLYSLLGHQIVSWPYTIYPEGRHEVDTNRSLLPGLYYLSFMQENGNGVTRAVFVW